MEKPHHLLQLRSRRQIVLCVSPTGELGFFFQSKMGSMCIEVHGKKIQLLCLNDKTLLKGLFSNYCNPHQGTDGVCEYSFRTISQLKDFKLLFRDFLVI